ncbi:MAG: DMT family transporter [Candidatus Krumholzibacteria bacterium]|nr:DMT family transporter [Candidatus Krumholzibacteria bacterium]
MSKGAEVGDRKAYAALVVAMISISFAAVFVRLSGAPPSSVAALRMIFSSILLLPFVLFSKKVRGELSSLGMKDAVLLFVSGGLLAIHFLTWITSLFLTGTVSSIVFVTASPLFVAVYSVVVYREKVPGFFWAGLGLAVVGAIVMGGNNLRVTGGASWKGDLLAVTGAVAAAGYFLTGSRLRRRLSLLSHLFYVYTVAAVILIAVLPFTGGSLRGLPVESYVYCLLMAVVCQGGGHSLLNWSMKRLRTTVVTFSVLAEPVGTTLLALFILGEVPLKSEVAGGLIIMMGLAIVIYFNQGSGTSRVARSY